MGGKGKGRHRLPTFKDSLTPVGERRPRIAAGSDRDDRPTWLLGKLELDGPWGWLAMDAETAARVKERLVGFESMTFGEIEGKKHHEIPRGRLCNEAQARLNGLDLDESWDLVLSLRVGTRERVWGLKSPSGVLLLWWDPEHTVYPMNITDN